MYMITCTKCNLSKSIEEFSWKDKAKCKKHKHCKLCQKLHDSTHKDESYFIRKRANRKAFAKRNRDFVFDYLSQHPCVDCGQTDPIVLEFDHISDKEKAISNVIHRWSLDHIVSEIEKCEVRCANCHRRKTAKQMNWHYN